MNLNMRRTITLHFILSYIDMVEHRLLTVYKRRDGSEFIVRRKRDGREVRLTLDDANNVYLTKDTK